jgi:hypothetical protein
MLKRGDDVDDVYDEVRTTVPSHNHATEILSTEEPFLHTRIYSSPLISALRCGQEMDSQDNTYRWSQLGFQLPARPPNNKTGFIILTIIL